jgi:uncharacterized membrane protein YoaK (UPF0700 family)
VFRRHAPGWVYAGGFVLSLTAGWLNAIGYLGFAHRALSHVTGTVTLSSIELSRGGAGAFAKAMSIVVCFFVGAALSGFVVRDPSLHAGRRYGVALLIESLLLAGALLLFRLESPGAEYFAAAACGLQNALATSYSGAVIRTTHMTGIVTDLGLAIGLALHGRPQDWMRFRLHLVLFAGFVAGGVGGATSYARFGASALLLPVLVTAGAGSVYTIWQHLARRRHAPPAP